MTMTVLGRFLQHENSFKLSIASIYPHTHVNFMNIFKSNFNNNYAIVAFYLLIYNSLYARVRKYCAKYYLKAINLMLRCFLH